MYILTLCGVNYGFPGTQSSLKTVLVISVDL